MLPTGFAISAACHLAQIHEWHVMAVPSAKCLLVPPVSKWHKWHKWHDISISVLVLNCSARGCKATGYTATCFTHNKRHMACGETAAAEPLPPGETETLMAFCRHKWISQYIVSQSVSHSPLAQPQHQTTNTHKKKKTYDRHSQRPKVPKCPKVLQRVFHNTGCRWFRARCMINTYRSTHCNQLWRVQKKYLAPEAMGLASFNFTLCFDSDSGCHWLVVM